MLNKLIERSTSILLLVALQAQAIQLKQLESVVDASNADTSTSSSSSVATTNDEPVVDNPFSFTVEELLEEGEKKFAVEDEEAEAYYYSGTPSSTYPPGYSEYMPGTYEDHCYCHSCPPHEPYECPTCDIVECPNLCDIAICEGGPGSGVITSSHTDSIDIIAGSTDTLPGSTANEIVACNECGVAVGSNKQCGTGYVEKSFYIDGCIKVHETTDTH